MKAVPQILISSRTSKLSLEEIDVLFGDNIVDHHNGAATHSYIPDQQSDVKEELAYVEQV